MPKMSDIPSAMLRGIAYALTLNHHLPRNHSSVTLPPIVSAPIIRAQQVCDEDRARKVCRDIQPSSRSVVASEPSAEPAWFPTCGFHKVRDKDFSKSRTRIGVHPRLRQINSGQFLDCRDWKWLEESRDLAKKRNSPCSFGCKAGRTSACWLMNWVFTANAYMPSVNSCGCVAI